MTTAAEHPVAAVADGKAYPAVTRLDSLDLLRGLCALAVAVFHYHSWGGLPAPGAAEGFLALCGTYGVSIFFVLSGFSLSHAYRYKFDDGAGKAAIVRYARRRIGRLGPLFAAIVVASVAGRMVSGGNVPDPLQIVANLTLLFGFVNPAATPVVGGWSIGIEVVFYVLFPLLLVAREKWFPILAASAFTTLWLSLAVAQHATLAEGWDAYVNPANHVIFFAGGVYAALIPRSLSLPSWLSPGILVVLVVVAMVALSYGASELDVVTGLQRVCLVPLSILLVWALSRIAMGRLKLASSLLGGASYPLYLIHPLLYFLAARFMPGASMWYLLLLGAALGIAVAVDLLVDTPLQRRVKAAGW